MEVLIKLGIFIGTVIVVFFIKWCIQSEKDRLDTDCKCKSCGWLGSNKQWEKYKHCPNCKSDRREEQRMND